MLEDTMLVVSVRKDCGRCGATMVHEARIPEDHADRWTLQERVNIATSRCWTRFTREGWDSWSTIHVMCPGCHAFVRSRNRKVMEGEEAQSPGRSE